ncbi:ABC transporter ATP-binding protein [Dyadobacter tibetensis]|uniref:ABC transporter ATP-binding protein n=1 Tax=Dyadobacter tibetensis TaxID=1211851 RepID=UPI00046F7DCC|nr:ABC transporter ATP-binding protein [Dyadobacter tibetensis]
MRDTRGIIIEDLCLIYPGSPRFAIKDLSLSIAQGAVFGLLGPNGAGKSSLIAMLCGLIRPTSGLIHFRDSGDLISPELVKGHLGFVPQEYAFYPELTAAQNLHYFGAMSNMSRARISLRQNELFTVLGLNDVRNKKVETFSGGMKRRLNLVIGIVHQPKFLFLDEPTVGVDVQSKEAIINYLKKIKDEGTTIVYTSHHLTEAQDICDHIAMLDHGVLVANGPTDELLSRHKSRNLQSLFIDLTGTAYRD